MNQTDALKLILNFRLRTFTHNLFDQQISLRVLIKMGQFSLSFCVRSDCGIWKQSNMYLVRFMKRVS